MSEAKDNPVSSRLGSIMCLPGKRSVKGLALATLLLASCLVSRRAYAQDAQSKSTDRISGTVVNSVTREPIGHALVLSSDERFATMTDGDGRFEFTLPQPEAAQGDATPSAQPRFSGNNRPYALTARKPGFLPDPDAPVQNLPGLQSGRDVTIPLVPEAFIVGRVGLPGEEAPDGVQVEIYRQQIQNGRAHWVPGAGGETTRSSGDFRFAELAAGSYKVFTHESMDRDQQASAPGTQMYGYAPVYFPNAKDFASAATIQLTPGRVVQVDLFLVRQPYYRIKIPVANVPAGTFIGVTVSPQGREGPGYSLGYDSQQQAITGALPSGSYRLDAVSYGPVSVSGSLNITVNGPVQAPVLVVLPNPPINVNVRENFTSKEVETVRDFGPQIQIGPGGISNQQRARNNVNVNLEPVDDFRGRGSPSGRPHSDSQDDSIILENVPPGRYWVQIHSARGYPASVTSGGVDLLHQPLAVQAGVSTAPIEVTLRDDTAQIEGTVEFVNTSSEPAPATAESPGQTAAPSPPSTVHVYCIPLPESSGRFTDIYVQPDGKFTAPPLPPGEYRLLAFTRPQTLEYENPQAMRVYEGKGQVVRLSGGQTEHIKLQLISASEP